MSSPAQAGPSAPQEREKKILGKFLSRAKTLVKRGSEGGSRRLSLLSTKKKSGEASTTAPGTTAEGQEIVKVPRQQLFDERARKLGERFGLEIKPNEWHSTEGDALRVEKPIRMRVHRMCHKCNTTFGSAKECPNCQHPRCTKCTRYPPKRTEEEKKLSREKRAAILKAQKENAPIVPDYRFDGKDTFVLKRPSRTGGQDLIHKKPRQRIRRTCHECGTLFVTGSKKCEKCQHARCTDCPRDPPKKDKYPFGYPGDEFGPNAVPYHECHACKTIFAPNPTNETACKKCGHKKCDSCPRLKPRKIELEPDPEVLKSLNAKIENLKIK